MSDIPKMVGVKSSNIEGVAYAPETKTLHVRFKNGSLYKYQGVAPDIHAAFMSADSKGSHLSKNIAGKFVHQKVQG